MKHKLLLLLLLASQVVFAQNWRPISIGEKFNYQHPDSTQISQSVWVDSVETDGADTLYLLNRVVTPCGCSVNGFAVWLRNQDHFLNKVIRLKADGIWIFEGKQSWVLLPYATVGATWIFDSENQVDATVISNDVQEVFGTPDSVKTIALSNGLKFQLSRSFGLLSFPENGKITTLVGIEGRNVGALVPRFRDFVDIQVGDIFQYMEVNHPRYSKTTKSWPKYTVLTRHDWGDSVQVSLQVRTRAMVLSDPPTMHLYLDTVVWNYSANLLSWLNEYPKTLNYSIYAQAFGRVELVSTPFGRASKNIGGMYGNNYAPFMQPFPNSATDTMVKVYGELFFSYAVGLGETGFHRFNNDGIIDRNMIGYIKDGDTIGAVYDDAFLLLDSILFPPVVDTMQVDTMHMDSILGDGNVRLSIWGNPIKTALQLKIELPEGENGLLEIFSATGAMVYQETLQHQPEITITIPGAVFRAGVNVVRLQCRGKTVIKKVIIIPGK